MGCMKALVIVFVALGVGAGCSGQAITSDARQGTPQGTAGSGAAGGQSSSLGGAAMQPGERPEAALCTPPGDVITTNTQAELEQHLIGAWLHCSGFMIFGVDHDGFEFADDGKWYFLKAAADGSLVRQKGFDGGGDWSVLDTSHFNGPGTFQVNLDTPSGSNAIFPTFQENPSSLLIVSTGGRAEYAAVQY